MSISVKIIDYYITTTTTLPVVNHCELSQRINDFIQKKDGKDVHRSLYSHLCKKLFQSNSCELAVFPRRQLTERSISCGDLLVCALSPKKGVVLCFIPFTESPLLNRVKVIKEFKEKNYPNCSGASTCMLSNVAISFLVCEDGMIDIDVNGSCTLQGLEIFILRYHNAHQTLYCRKLTPNLLIQSPSYIMGEVGSDYIFVDCVCREENFSFKIWLSVFSQKEVAAKVCSARQSRADALKLDHLREKTYLRSEKIFPKEVTHHVISLPDPMFLSLPFGLIRGGQLLLSQIGKDRILKFTCISDMFVSGESKRERHSIIFYPWQVGSLLFKKTNQSIKSITCFTDPSVTIVRKGDSNEFLVVGAQLKLICSTRGIWGMCFVKEGASSYDLQSETTTLISCTEKKSNLVMEQGHSNSAQAISDCDPDEGPLFNREQAISDCDPDEGPSSHCVQTILDCDPDEGIFQGAKNRPGKCLGLSFADQDFLLNSNWNPEEESQEAKNRSGECFELSFADQDFLLNSNWNPEEESQEAKNRSGECFELSFADQDFLLNSNWNPEEESQEAKNRSGECFELSFADQDFLLNSNWNPEEESQEAKNRSGECFELSFADQDFLLNSNWNPEEESQEAKNRSGECFELSFADQDSSKEQAWNAIRDIININHSSTTPSESVSTTSLEISSVSQDVTESNEETWIDICAIIEKSSLEGFQN